MMSIALHKALLDPTGLEVHRDFAASNAWVHISDKCAIITPSLIENYSSSHQEDLRAVVYRT